jgi:hypothetical protein
LQTFFLEPRWNYASPVSAEASIDLCDGFVNVSFAVKEAHCCFCQSKEHDGEEVWQDSCVEVFLKMLDGGGEYANFEFNSKGVCYAARGKDRQNRTELSKDEYIQIKRKPVGVSTEGDFCKWTLSVQIPGVLLGTADCDLQKLPVEGNLYKCADHAAQPHYLSAFPINTSKPDFHRPEFFSSLLPLALLVHK